MQALKRHLSHEVWTKSGGLDSLRQFGLGYGYCMSRTCRTKCRKYHVELAAFCLQHIGAAQSHDRNTVNWFTHSLWIPRDKDPLYSHMGSAGNYTEFVLTGKSPFCVQSSCFEYLCFHKQFLWVRYVQDSSACLKTAWETLSAKVTGHSIHCYPHGLINTEYWSFTLALNTQFNIFLTQQGL